MNKPKERKPENKLRNELKIPLSDGTVVSIEERYLKILGSAIITRCVAGYQTEPLQEQRSKIDPETMLRTIKNNLAMQIAKNLLDTLPIVQTDIPVAEGLQNMSVANSELAKGKRYMTEVLILMAKPEAPAQPCKHCNEPSTHTCWLCGVPLCESRGCLRQVHKKDPIHLQALAEKEKEKNPGEGHVN